MRKTNKIPGKEFAPSTLGHRHSLEYLMVPHLRLPFTQVLTARASKYTWQASAPQMGIQPEIKVKSRGRERKKRRERDMGETSPVTGSSPYCSEGLLYLFLIVHRDQWVIQNYSVLAVQTHQNQTFLSAYLIVYTSLR